MYDNVGIIYLMIVIYFWLLLILILWLEEDICSLLKIYICFFFCGMGFGWCGCGVVVDEFFWFLLVVMNFCWVSLVG